MKIFLSADMEGTCGIVSWPETERSTPFDYTPAQKQMTREVAAACRGALAAGADEILVNALRTGVNSQNMAQQKISL